MNKVPKQQKTVLLALLATTVLKELLILLDVYQELIVHLRVSCIRLVRVVPIVMRILIIKSKIVQSITTAQEEFPTPSSVPVVLSASKLQNWEPSVLLVTM